jgi:hypothetical protein
MLHIRQFSKIDLTKFLNDQQQYITKELPSNLNLSQNQNNLNIQVPNLQNIQIPNKNFENQNHENQNQFDNLTTQQKTLLSKFCQITGMKIESSFKCLKELNWDYPKSLECFTTNYNKKIIPISFFKDGHFDDFKQYSNINK